MSIVAGVLALIDQLRQFANQPEVQTAVTVGILLAVAVGLYSVRFLRTKTRKRFHNHVADVVFIGVVGTILVGSTVALLVLWSQFDNAASALEKVGTTAGDGFKVVLALALFAGAYVVTGFVKRAMDRFEEGHDTISKHQSEIVYRISQLGVYVAAVAAVLGMWNVDLSGLLVGAGFLGIVVGMAARQTLGSLLAGFVLMFSRPFEIGDWVEIDDEEGIVTDISIVNTRIQTFHGEFVMIPNDIVSGTKIVNKSRKGRLRLEVEVGVDYDADVRKAADLAEETMKELDEVLTVPTPQVVLKSLGDSSVELLLRFWIDKPSARRQWRARTAVIESVKSAFDDAGIKIPYPQRELTGREESHGFRLAGEPPAREVAPNGGDSDSPRERDAELKEGEE